MMYAVILAGGSGKRLWPLSRRECPKQLLDITCQEKPLLRETYARLEPLVPPDGIYVITAEQYVESTKEHLPSLPEGNVICEPQGRGSAPAIGLAALHLRRRDPDAVMACLPADHHITEPDRFRDVLSVAEEVAREGHLVTLGMKPDRPHTGYGYIEIGEQLMEKGGHAVHRVQCFTEKPEEDAAKSFVQGGRHFWNSGMFIWRAGTILEEIGKQLPRLHACLAEVEEVLGTEDERVVLERTWPNVEKETIDFGVMEKAQDVVVIPTEIGWTDVGDWATLTALLPSDGDGNVVVGHHMGLKTKSSLIYSPRRLVATVGIEDLIIIDTEDAILVCPRERAQEVKALVERLEEEGWRECL
ncbi:MAG: NTP transferase domain-containing protein [Anaerolineae bacterium]|nr:NTP transferase domain-containing protein [Anaerolineae bacterium]NIQ80513.1 NTP transferase domain-containing protein [Anaerolineae bacterium]